MSATTTTHRAKAPSRARRVASPSAKSTETSVAEYFKDEQAAAALLADSKTRNLAIGKMVTFARKDHEMSVTEIGYGEALHNILALPIEAQKQIVWAIADANNVPRPDYPEGPKQRGRQPSGRKQLAEAQYGLWPDMLTLEGKNKDTRAGMQITDHVRRYRIKAGLIEARATRVSAGVPKRTLRRSFEALWGIASEREAKMLTHLFTKLGVKTDDLTAWEAEAQSAEQSNAA